MVTKAVYQVPTDVLVGFLEEVVSKGMQASVAGTNDEGAFLLEVDYDKDETSDVDDLESILEKLIEESGLDND